MTAELDRTAAKKPPARALVWQSLAGLGLPALGVVTISVGKKSARYLVTEVGSPDAIRRAFRLSKPAGEPATDEEADHYDVVCGREGDGPARARGCECRGFLRHNRCKHADAVALLLDRGTLPEPLGNPEADAGDCEPPAYCDDYGF